MNYQPLEGEITLMEMRQHFARIQKEHAPQKKHFWIFSTETPGIRYDFSTLTIQGARRLLGYPEIRPCRNCMAKTGCCKRLYENADMAPFLK